MCKEGNWAKRMREEILTCLHEIEKEFRRPKVPVDEYNGVFCSALGETWH